MNKGILIILFVLFSFALYSCSSAPSMAGSNDVSYEMYDSSDSGRSQSSDANNNRMIAYSVYLELNVKEPEETRNMLIEFIDESNGFIVTETDNYIRSRIPSENMESYVSRAKTLGTIKTESKTGSDITDQYRDNVIRVESLKSVRDRYLALLDRANTINEILTIEKELERIILEIERLEGRIKNAELRVQYSEVTIRFGERAKPGPIGWVFYGLYRGIKWLFVWN